MEHSEAVREMAAERYLLDELPPEARDAFEEHMFDCSECALDVRAGSAFVEEAKAQLPELTTTLPAPIPAATEKPEVQRKKWFSWWNPSFAAPAFATLLLLVGYQNLVTLPALRAAANQPRLVPWAPLQGATRGGAQKTLTADRKHGVAFPVDLTQETGTATYVSYSFDLYDSKGKLVWTGVVAAPGDGETSNQQLSLVIPGAMLQNGAYTVAVSGIATHGERTAVGRYTFDLHLTD